VKQASETCARHKPYARKADAVSDMEKLRRAARETKRQGGSYKRLNVYFCGPNTLVPYDHFHVGRSSAPIEEKPAPQPKPLSPGQARRKILHEQKEAERHAKRAQLFADFNQSVSIAMAELDRELSLTAAAQKGR
jgi:hypothetical protein